VPAIARRAFWSILLLTTTTSWSALLVSIELGRTTPASVSRTWLIAFIGVQVGITAWCVLLGLTLKRGLGLSADKALTRVAVSSTPLLLAAITLVTIYGSDALFHFVTNRAIPRSLVLWIPSIGCILAQAAVLLWQLSDSGPIRAWLRRAYAPHLLIFVVLACLYLFTAGGHLYSPDESAMYYVTQNLVDRGSVAIPRDEPAIARGNAPFWYSKYGLVPSLLGIPGYWISSILGIEADPPSPAFPIPNAAPPLLDLMVNPLITAGTSVLLFILARRFGFRSTTALAVVAIYALSTSAWVYSKTFFSQPSAAMFLLGAFCLAMPGYRPRPVHLGLAGISLGLAIGSRVEILVLASPLAAVFLRQLARNPHLRLRGTVALGTGLLASTALLVGWYNYVKTGSFLLTGHGGQGTLAGLSADPLVGLYGSLFSPGFGLFVYNPITILGLCCLPLLALRRRLATYVIGGVFLLCLLLYGSFEDWFGGFTWANRYMVAILPLLVLPVATLLERPWRSPLSLLLVTVVVLLGLAVNFLAVLFDFNSGWLNLWDRGANLDLILWNPHYSPIGAHLRLLHDFMFTGAKLDLYLYYKFGVPSLALFLGLFSGLLILTIRSVLVIDACHSPFLDRNCSAESSLLYGGRLRISDGEATPIPKTVGSESCDQSIRPQQDPSAAINEVPLS